MVCSQGIHYFEALLCLAADTFTFSSVWEMAAVVCADWTLWPAWCPGKCNSELRLHNKPYSMQNWSCICHCRCCDGELYAYIGTALYWMEWERVEQFPPPSAPNRGSSAQPEPVLQDVENQLSTLCLQDLPQGLYMQGSNEQESIWVVLCCNVSMWETVLQLVWILVSPFFPFKSLLSVLFSNHVPLLRHSWRKPLLPYLHISWTSWNPAKTWRYQKLSQSVCCLVLWVNCTIAP